MGARVHYFHSYTGRKTAASKARVSAMAATAVLSIDRARRERERLDEKARQRQIVCDELRFAMQKVYGVFGPDEATRLVNWTEAAVAVEHRSRS